MPKKDDLEKEISVKMRLLLLPTLALAASSFDNGPILEHIMLWNCRVLTHVISKNDSSSSLSLSSAFLRSLESEIPVLVQDDGVDMSLESNEHGRSCITSFSAQAIHSVNFKHRQRRPFRLLLNSREEDFIVKNFQNDPLDFETAPIAILDKTSDAIWTTKVFCPDVDGHSKHIWAKDNETWGKVISSHARFICRPDLMKKTLKACGIGSPPYFVPMANGEISGTEVKVMRVLADQLGFILYVEKCDEWLNKKVYENGTEEWTGAIGKVLKGEATFAVSEIYLLEYTFKLADWIFHYNFYMHYKTAKPKVSKKESSKF